MPTTLTAAEILDARRKLANDLGTVNWTKAQVKAALDAIDAKFEDEWEAEGSTAVDAATSPLGITFTNPQKKKIFKYWLEQKFFKE